MGARAIPAAPAPDPARKETTRASSATGRAGLVVPSRRSGPGTREFGPERGWPSPAACLEWAPTLLGQAALAREWSQVRPGPQPDAHHHVRPGRSGPLRSRRVHQPHAHHHHRSLDLPWSRCSVRGLGQGMSPASAGQRTSAPGRVSEADSPCALLQQSAEARQPQPREHGAAAPVWSSWPVGPVLMADARWPTRDSHRRPARPGQSRGTLARCAGPVLGRGPKGWLGQPCSGEWQAGKEAGQPRTYRLAPAPDQGTTSCKFLLP
jgi:hypothetical protein